MLAQTLALSLIFSLVGAAATVKSGVYHLVNLGYPYAAASFDSNNRVYLPQPFNGNYDLWEVVAPSGSVNGITVQNLRELQPYAQISSPAEGQFVSTGSVSTPFSTVWSGTADFPGDGEFIPDTRLDYWTIGAPNGLVWTFDSSAGPEVSLQSLDANRTEGQYWMFAAKGSLPFLPRDLESDM